MPFQTEAGPGGQHDTSMPNFRRFFSSGHRAISARTELNEQHLMHRLAEGDVLAFRGLWEPYRNYLYACCSRWLGPSRHEVDDALSRASIKALNGLIDSGRNITNLKG